MRIHKLSPFGQVVNLDNPETYSHLPNTDRELDDLMFKHIGYAYCYMNFFNTDLDWEGCGQKQRVHKLIQEYCTNRQYKWGDHMWFKEQVFLFEDEIENMC